MDFEIDFKFGEWNPSECIQIDLENVFRYNQMRELQRRQGFDITDLCISICVPNVAWLAHLLCITAKKISWSCFHLPLKWSKQLLSLVCVYCEASRHHVTVTVKSINSCVVDTQCLEPVIVKMISYNLGFLTIYFSNNIQSEHGSE